MNGGWHHISSELCWYVLTLGARSLQCAAFTPNDGARGKGKLSAIWHKQRSGHEVHLGSRRCEHCSICLDVIVSKHSIFSSTPLPAQSPLTRLTGIALDTSFSNGALRPPVSPIELRNVPLPGYLKYAHWRIR